MKSFSLILLSCILNLSIFSQTNNILSRDGFVFGFSSGIVNSNLNFPSETQNNTNLALNWKVGYMVNSKLALLLNGVVSIYEYTLSDRQRLRDFGGLFPSVQYFVSDKF